MVPLNGVWVGSAGCPRCCHELTVLLPRVFGLDGTIELPIICNCTEPHQPRTERSQDAGVMPAPDARSRVEGA